MPDLRQVSPTEAATLVTEGALLLDVREIPEWQAGHAPGAVHMPMATVTERAAELPSQRVIVCVCRVGGRSAVVADALLQGGWDAVNLAGGMEAWAAAGLAVVDDTGGSGTVV